MSPLRRFLILSLLSVGVGVASGAELKIPPLTGELTGDFLALKIVGAPTLHWKMALRSATADERLVDLTAEAEGIRLRIELRTDAAGNGTWRLREGRLESGAPVQQFVAAQWPKAASLVWTGTLLLSGEGTLRGDQVTGRLNVDLRDGSVRDAADTWALADIGLTGTFGLSDYASDGLVRLTFSEARGVGLAARNGIVEFTLDAQQVVRVTRAESGLIGGHVTFGPFEFPLARPEVETAVDFAGVELSGLKKLLPPALSDASGPVSGRVDVRWTLANGLVFANGSLQPKANETALIRLAPAPGFLTGRMPAKVRDVLPSWLGPMRQLFPAKIPAYETLRDVELGKIPLNVKTVVIAMQPDGAPDGKSAQITVITKPVGESSAIDAVRFEINVTGPMADLVRLALEGRLSGHLR
jgi:hypothetical protein